MAMYYDMYFTGKPDGPNIEKYIAHYKLVYPQFVEIHGERLFTRGC